MAGARAVQRTRTRSTGLLQNVIHPTFCYDLSACQGNPPDLGARRGEKRQCTWRETVWVCACRHPDLWSTARCETAFAPASRDGRKQLRGGKANFRKQCASHENNKSKRSCAERGRRVTARGQGKKRKDTSKGKGKSKSGGKGKDKGQTSKGKNETSGEDRTCDSYEQRGHIAKDHKTCGVAEVQTYLQHPPGLSPGQAHPFFANSEHVCSILTFHGVSSVGRVNDASCE